MTHVGLAAFDVINDNSVSGISGWARYHHTTCVHRHHWAAAFHLSLLSYLQTEKNISQIAEPSYVIELFPNFPWPSLLQRTIDCSILILEDRSLLFSPDTHWGFLLYLLLLPLAQTGKHDWWKPVLYILDGMASNLMLLKRSFLWNVRKPRIRRKEVWL